MKTSLRGEQRALREEMRALGLSHRQIAVEFARRYQLRPRAAWRHAWGWSLAEAAERISGYAGRAGRDPDGGAVTMTAPHLSEYENWPGAGLSRPGGGQRPTCCPCLPPCTSARSATCLTWLTTSACQHPTSSLSTGPTWRAPLPPDAESHCARSRHPAGGWREGASLLAATQEEACGRGPHRREGPLPPGCPAASRASSG